MPSRNQHPGTWVLQWPTFGPYHVARWNRAANLLKEYGINLIGFEIAPMESEYGWSKIDCPEKCEHILVFPETIYEEIPFRRMWGGIYSKLNNLWPDGVVINGYSSVDAYALLAWARLHRKPAILMSDSKQDDAPRTEIRERIKSCLVRHFSAAVCGGRAHKRYLEQLGMSKEKIYLGYDAVDNDYFFHQAIVVRNNPDKYRHLPGLDSEVPCFLASARLIARKNIDGLLQAYKQYKLKSLNMGMPRPWRLVVLGDGEEKEKLETLILKENIEGVTLAGFHQVEEIPAYYALSNLFIHSALQDQWGVVVNEAMACGLPVLVSRQSGCAGELVQNGVNGFVFDAFDMMSLSTLMFQFSSGIYDLESFGRSSQEIIKNWGTERFAEGIYSAIMCSTY